MDESTKKVRGTVRKVQKKPPKMQETVIKNKHLNNPDEPKMA